ncbi:DUF342 domain-containing protein [Psychromonas aquimarina]|uniref:DUF342 domain-containing protein n=1 Tax=Psychromonas aquimarina TaxID=444919 RepID=UPI00040E5104|nr:FapA family protein [Psychromonas aquimarina]
MENKQSLSTNLLRLSTDKSQLLLLITAVQEEINEASLTEIFHQSDYTSLKLNTDGIKQAVQSFQRLESEKERSAELESIAIADRLDAQLSITFDPLKMQAKARIVCAYAGSAVTLEQLKQEMDELEINTGISEKTLHLLVNKSAQAKPGTVYQATIAKGKQPVNGTDATFERLVETPRERLLRPKKISEDRVDMRNLGELITVKPGSELMRKHPHTEGCSGITVTGEIVKHTPGKDFSLEVGENTEISSTDPNLLTASIAGIPKVLSNGMMVDDVLTIDNVDVGNGHVDYEGSVIVTGDICDGMKVNASGDITVAGFIESADITCGGDLIVSKGILGHQIEPGSDKFSCNINCKGTVAANLSQYSKIHAGQELNIKNQLLHCHVICAGEINVKDDSGMKGTILGGLLCTSKGVNTVTLGASAGTRTTIDLIGEYPKLMENKKQIKAAIAAAEEKLQSVADTQRKIAIFPDSQKKQEISDNLLLTKDHAEKRILELNAQLEDYLTALQAYFDQAKVIAAKELHNDVSVLIGRDVFRSARSYGPTKIQVQEYKLSAEPFLP